jgi:3-oxoacyl-[acyl-carrier-protein] synthase II
MRSLDVVVTGLGVWSAAGTSPEGLFETALRARPAAVRKVFGQQTVAVCEAPVPPPIDGFPQARHMDLAVRLALAAGFPAFTAGGLRELDPGRIAILVGTSRGPAGKVAGGARVRPSQATHTAIASLSGALSLALGVRGPCLTVSATCASSAHAIAIGALLLESGVVDAVLAGGAEAPITTELMEQFAAASILGNARDPAMACRPFDTARDGTAIGEGSAFLALTRAADVGARGLAPLARLAGFAMGAESHNRASLRADGEGLAKTIAQALARGGIAPEQIGYINAHGTGTVINDTSEAAALRRVLGVHIGRVPVSSTKAVTGHCLGATAAMEAVLTIAALRRQLAPPTTGCLQPDPGLGLDIVHGAPRPISGRFAMSTSLGLWGNTACLIFAQADT